MPLVPCTSFVGSASFQCCGLVVFFDTACLLFVRDVTSGYFSELLLGLRSQIWIKVAIFGGVVEASVSGKPSL